MAKKVCYVITKGRDVTEPIIVHTWGECEDRVKGYPGAIFSGFPSVKEAEQYIAREPRTVPNQKKSGVIYIYADGACSPNPGIGGWASTLEYTDPSGKVYTKELSGSSEFSTNNRMEITAVTQALLAIKKPTNIHLYSDSKYVINCMRLQWFKKWQENGWKNAKGDKVENRDLWEELIKVIESLKKAGSQIHFAHVPGHDGVAGNERVDKLAVQARLKLAAELGLRR